MEGEDLRGSATKGWRSERRGAERLKMGYLRLEKYG